MIGFCLMINERKIGMIGLSKRHFFNGGLKMGKPLEIDDLWSKRISDTLNGIEYGTVQIIIHDGKIVQIERTERSRFNEEIKHTIKSK